MDRSTKLIILQGIGISVQIINAQIAVITQNAAFALIIGALTAGFQFIIQHVGNNTIPVAAIKEIEKCSRTDS